MRIAMIGSGYVGLVSGACFAQFGHDVVCIDKEEAKIKLLRQGVMPIYEPGLDKLVADNVKAGRLSFATGLRDAVGNADAVFIAVGTPTRRGDGHADLSYVYAAAAEVADAIQHYTVVVTKSTVPVGTGREVARIIRETQPAAEFDVCSNPEFLREGAAIEDFMKPDRVVIGVESTRARDVMAGVYRPLNLIQTPMVFTNIETAEVTKYAGNAFPATKITFINEIADLCERLGADVHDVARGIGLDGRIGRKFLHPGPGYGGSCFPKDTLALVRTAQEAKAPLRIVETVVDINDQRKKRMAQKIIDAVGGSVAGKTVAVLGLTFKPNTDDMRDSPSLDIVPALQKAGAPLRIIETVVAINDQRKKRMAQKIIDAVGGSAAGKTVAVLGLTFKPNTDDMRDSPSLDIVPALQKAGATVRAFDPEGMAEARKLLTDVVWCDTAYECMGGADALAIVTEWNEFRALDFGRVKRLMREPVLVDLRNIYEADAVTAAGFTYVCIGRSAVPAGVEQPA
ncbi:MAG: UDP-glucose/GDP-mannose dehydrogenase family protein [Alphaproteobacteria bacterium]|nr:UDP-glucose/GDP-mannose dehydrogenase family protein [Alphaproteobacteria bacterium]